MGLKKRPPPQGAPMWIVTYGDMMTLLLCFFILLAAFANYDKKDKLFMTAIESIREALGAPGQKGWLPDDEIDFKSLLVRLESLIPPDRPKKEGYSDELGLDGKYYRVKNVRDGIEVVVGGPIAFGPFSAEIEPEADQLLAKIAPELIGKSNKIEIRGHATSEPLPLEGAYRDTLDLGYARARNTRDRLVELGVDPRTIRVSSAGNYEPVQNQTFQDGRRAANRRVEVVITQALRSEYTPPPPSREELISQAPPPTVVSVRGRRKPTGPDELRDPVARPKQADDPPIARQVGDSQTRRRLSQFAGPTRGTIDEADGPSKIVTRK
jgi:chemotaxis protein MotB